MEPDFEGNTFYQSFQDHITKMVDMPKFNKPLKSFSKTLKNPIILKFGKRTTGTQGLKRL